MIRSTKHTLKYANLQKRKLLQEILAEYRKVAQEIIDWIWAGNYPGFDPTTRKLRLPRLAPAEVTSQLDTWLSARLKQCAAKQALGMLQAAVAKQRKRFYILRKEQRKGADNHKDLQRYIDQHSVVKPLAAKINMELDSRFVDLRETTEGKFDLFLRLSSIGSRVQTRLPIKHHKRSQHWLKQGKFKASIRVADKYLTLLYEVPDKPRKKRGRTLGCDQGYLTTASFADQEQENTLVTPEQDQHNHTLKSICEKVARRQPGSKGKQRAIEHRKNFINWALNQINFAYVKQVNLEQIKHLRFKRKQFNKALMHWTYTDIRRKLLALSEEKGFLITEQDSVYRSQRCSQCGWVLKTNRVGKVFTCGSCNFSGDADLNAAANHARSDLPKIPYWVRQRKLNQEGFFWLPTGLFTAGHEPIVRDTQRAAS